MPLVVAGALGGIISAAATFLIEPEFQSSVVLFALPQQSIGAQFYEVEKREDILAYGETEDAERLLQILNSDRIRTRIIQKYDLWLHYDIDRTFSASGRTVFDGEVTVTGGEEGRIYAFFSNDNKLYVSSTSGSIGAEAIEVLANSEVSGNSDAATAFGLSVGTGPTPSASGFSAYDYRLRIDGAQITATRVSSSATLTASASATSSVGERLTMSDLPDEELIILVTGGARRIAAGYDMLPDGNPTLPSDLTVKVLDASAGTVEFIDTATGTSLANRTLDSEGKASARGIQVKLDGILQAGDKFHVTSNSSGIGDARTMLELADLQRPTAGRGGFQEVFSRVVSGVGSSLQSTKVTNDAAKELHNASLEIESSFSGVSLDAEAANLIQQQQAYQASARILSTAREIFRTLLETV